MIDVRSSVGRLRAACSTLLSPKKETGSSDSGRSGSSQPENHATQNEQEQIKRRLQKLVRADYKVEEWIGGGSMGNVFRARHMRLHSIKAIKVLAPRLASDEVQLERFLREAKIGANLEHPNIVGVIDYGRSGDFVYLIMSYIAGKDLETLSNIQNDSGQTRRQWNPSEVFTITSQVAQALEAAHAHGIVHRDLKLSNICIDYSGRVVVLDFGIARLRSAGSTGGTMTGELLGTPLYMSPEQVQGEPADARSDLYSLGVIMYEMLAGKNPFDAENPQAVLYKHLSFSPALLNTLREDVPESLSKAVERLLMKDPKERYQTATALRSDLMEIESSIARSKQKGGMSSSIGALAGLVSMDSMLHHNPQIKLNRDLTSNEQEILKFADGEHSIEKVLDSVKIDRNEALSAINSLRSDGVVYIGIPGISMPAEDKKGLQRRSWKPLAVVGGVIVIAAAALAGYFALRAPVVQQVIQVNASPFAMVTIRNKDGVVVVQNDTPFQTSLFPGAYTMEFVSGEQRYTKNIEVGKTPLGLIKAEFWGKEKSREVLNSYR